MQTEGEETWHLHTVGGLWNGTAHFRLEGYPVLHALDIASILASILGDNMEFVGDCYFLFCLEYIFHL